VAHGLSDLPSGITLRPVSSSDRDFLVHVYASTREEELAPVSWPDAEKAAFIEQQFDAQDRHYRTHYAGASLDVVEWDGAPAGRLYVARWSDEIRIIDITLLPEHRGAGIGTRLIRELLDEGRRTGNRVTIHVEKNNPALRLYQRLGFVVVADKGLHLLMEASPAEPG
jgi:ribosomal protein S18 acetylase RimI-like enzyme